MKRFTVKRSRNSFILVVVGIACMATSVAYAAPINLEGGGVYWEETNSLGLNVDCPTGGVLTVGAKLFRDDGIALGYWSLFVDSETVLWYVASAGSQNLPVEAGTHTISVTMDTPTDISLCEYRLWAIFWPEKQNAVAERPDDGGDTPVSSVEGIRSRVARISEVLTITDQTCVYDAAGRLLDRPVGFWIPAEAGVYFLSGDALQKVVVVE